MMEDRSRLIQLLAGDTDVLSLARAALVRGSPFEIWPKDVPIARLRSIYGRRYRAAERAGQPSVGFEDALEDLAAYDGSTASIGYVDDRSAGGFYFQIFMDPSRSRVIACWAIKRSDEDDIRLNA